MKKPVFIIGLGVDGDRSLSAETQALIQSAQVLIGGQRLLSALEDHPAEKVTIGKNVDEILARLKERDGESIVVLASGDPGFHGIAGTLLKHLPAEEIRILPNVSSLQAAFARAGFDWSEAIFTSAHAHSLAQIIGWARRAPRLGILTDFQNSPAAIAAQLIEAGIPDCQAFVAENLGTEQEHLIDGKLSNLIDMDFAPLNVMLLIQPLGWQPDPVFDIRSEADYAHRRGLITKTDIRTLSIARLQIRPTDIIWDIGAGSGAISIEMAGLAWQGTVYAIEKDPQNLAFIKENCRKHGALNVELIEGQAPEVLKKLPAPNGVFVGGTSGNLPPIFDAIADTASTNCRVVCNFATLENINLAFQKMKSLGWQPSFSQVNIAHSKSIASRNRLEPLNPVFILQGVKP